MGRHLITEQCTRVVANIGAYMIFSVNMSNNRICLRNTLWVYIDINKSRFIYVCYIDVYFRVT